MKTSALLLLALLCNPLVGADAPAWLRIQGVIPAPSSRVVENGRFAFTPETRVVATGGDGAQARVLQAALRTKLGVEVSLGSSGETSPHSIVLQRLPLVGGAASDEGYALSVRPDGVTVQAVTDAGFFYAFQTLLQLAEKTGQPAAWSLPAGRIEDRPRFAWRGLMLDESRHFFGKQTVLRLLDVMAQLKLNRFHWHLTDEPGWRIEIRKYPRLTTVGGVGNWSDGNTPAAFYTQDDIREIVAYAQQRHIVIVPEIDMPGHATAACRAYPELSGGRTGPKPDFTFNPAKEETYRFLTDVLTEIAALFPGPYLHIGGDEVHFGNEAWGTDPEMVAFSRSHGLNGPLELERYFTRRIAAIVKGLGKTAVGWDEIGDAGVPSADCVIMWWRHDKPEVLSRLLTRGQAVVLCPRIPCYFDFVQSSSHTQGRRWGGAFNDLDRVWAFPDGAPQPPGVADATPNILGIQGCVWTERMQNTDRLWYMVMPRLAALAEAAWTPAAAKDHAGFIERVRVLIRALDDARVPHFDPFAPARTPEVQGPARRADGTAVG